MIITKLHRTHRCSLFVTNVPFCVSMLAITMSCAEMDKPIKMSCGDVDLGVPKEPCSRWGSRSPGEWTIFL